MGFGRSTLKKLFCFKISPRYIQRFRYGRPQSRGERQKLAANGADNQPFWWMSSNPSQPSSSTPTRTSKECLRGVLQWIALVNPKQTSPNTMHMSFFTGVLDSFIIDNQKFKPFWLECLPYIVLSSPLTQKNKK